MPQLCKEEENRTEKGNGDFDDEEMKIKSAIFVTLLKNWVLSVQVLFLLKC